MHIADYIEHTNLKPDATPDHIKTLCSEALSYHFKAVCVHSSYVTEARALLQGSNVLISCVVGFPLGAMASAVKQEEAAYAVRQGADELDMVIAIGRLKAGDWDYVAADIRAGIAGASGKPVKVILETGLLTEDETYRACQEAAAAGAAFVKTSTGFGYGGATVEDIRRMRRAVGISTRIKASGGIRDYKTACAMIQAGADRLGTSAGVAIVKDEGHDRE